MAQNQLIQDVQSNAQRIGRWLGLRGVITMVFGFLFLARPSYGLGFLVAVFGVYCLADGILALVAAARGTWLQSRGALVFQGVVGVLAGILTFAKPGPAAIAILIIVAVRAMVVGLFELVAALRLGKAIPQPWLVGLSGVASIIFGILLVSRPQAGLVTLAALVGLYGVIVGVLQLVGAVYLRSAAKRAVPMQPIAQP